MKLNNPQKSYNINLLLFFKKGSMFKLFFQWNTGYLQRSHTRRTTPKTVHHLSIFVCSTYVPRDKFWKMLHHLQGWFPRMVQFHFEKQQTDSLFKKNGELKQGKGTKNQVWSKGKPKGFTVFIPKGLRVFRSWMNLCSRTLKSWD